MLLNQVACGEPQTQNHPNKQQLAKAERIIHDMEGSIWKLYEIFGYKGYETALKQIHEMESILWNIRRDTLDKHTKLKCGYCGKPVFTPVYINYIEWAPREYTPFHKRCINNYLRFHSKKETQCKI